MGSAAGNSDREAVDGLRRRHPLARGIELLTLMTDSDHDVHGVRELAGRLEVSPSTAHRLIADLEKLGLVSRTANGSYRLGLEYLRLAWTTTERYPIQEVSRDTLQELTEQSGESSFFAVFGEQRLKMMFALVVESSHPLRYTLPLRQQLPLHAGASGLAILAFLPAQIQASVAHGRLHPATDRTLVRSESLLDRLAIIRSDGYAITHGERIEGAIAIASPVFGPSGTVVGSAGISLPEARFNAAHTSSLAGLVKQSARQITDYLTGARDPRTGIARK
ncbi:IclR family transcriptional regulator [Micrococcaceae bacterium Sec5.1]|uniref:IclR family transcriptional regulator n=1 Tax=Paenarthrobacter sp. 2TAF44 TaxID=3233018 RepID=UPI00336955CE